MQIAVDIPGWLYNAMMECKEPHYSRSLGEAVRDGTPLPKNHGRLIDADAFVKYCTDGLSFFLPMFKTEEYRNLAIDVTKSIIKDIEEAPTIIEATETEVKE